MQNIHAIQLEPIVTRALEEDWGYGDWTTDICIAQDSVASAKIIAKEQLVTAGIDVANHVFNKVDGNLKVHCKVENGQAVEKGQELITIEGSSRSILRAERVALNFLGRLCGIASLSKAFVDELQGSKTQLLDTRKTTPGLRILEKSATILGGARNHRFGLCDGVIIKENHIRACGSISQAVEKFSKRTQ